MERFSPIEIFNVLNRDKEIVITSIVIQRNHIVAKAKEKITFAIDARVAGGIHGLFLAAKTEQRIELARKRFVGFPLFDVFVDGTGTLSGFNRERAIASTGENQITLTIKEVFWIDESTVFFILFADLLIESRTDGIEGILDA